MDEDHGEALAEKGYKKGNKLGEGTYGIVYAGVQLTSGTFIILIIVNYFNSSVFVRPEWH